MTVTRGDWGDEFAAICDAHRGRLVRWLTAIFGPRNAEDIAQEALTRLYVRPGMLRAGTDAWPWLAVVARNVGRDLARRDAYTTFVDSEVLETFGADAGVHDTVAARDDAVRLAAALRTISARDRLLLQLRDVEGVPVAEIAERLRCNDNTVRQQVFRARRRLANAYLAQGGERRTGLVALLGLKARELARRCGHAVEAAWPTASGVLAVMAPFVAAVVGGTFAPAPSSAPGVRAATRTELTFDVVDSATHGARGASAPRSGRPATGTVPSTAAQASPPPGQLHVDEKVGPATVRVQNRVFQGRPRGSRDGTSVGGSLLDWQVERYTWTSGGAESRLCKVLDCYGPVPRPLATPAGDPEGR